MSIILLIIFISNLLAQIYSTRDMINIYDPFTISFDNFVLNTNDDEFKEHNHIVIATITVGADRIYKFFYKDDLMITNIKSTRDDIWQISFKVKKNNIVLIPALSNFINNNGQITIKLEGYSNLSPGDETVMNQLSTAYVYTGSQMYYAMELAYKYLATSADVCKPNTGMITSAEVLQRNISTRPGIFYLSNPYEVSYIIPKDPSKVIGTNILIQGQKKLESKITARNIDQWDITFTKYLDVKIVQNESYYAKAKALFSDISNMPRIDKYKSEGLIARCDEIIKEDLLIGGKSGVYLNDQVVEQLTYLMNFLKATIRAKSDTLETTSDVMRGDERNALSYFETNLKSTELNLQNQYLYDDFIAGAVNRGLIQKDIDILRKYYQIR